MANHVFNLGSIFDPDYTGVGHQPAFHDQWATLYNRYRVIGVRYKVIFRTGMQDTDVQQQMQTHTDLTSGETYPYILKQDWRDRHIVFTEVNEDLSWDFTEATDKNFLRETGNKMTGVQWRYGPSKRGTVLSGYVNPKNLKWNTDEVGNSNVMGAGPTYPFYLNVGAMSKTGDTTNAIGFDIKLNYLVEFSDAKNIGSS